MTKIRIVVVVATIACILGGCAERSTMLVFPDAQDSCAGVEPLSRPLVVANYNIKSGMWSSLDEVGKVLEELEADVIALEEVDNGMERTDGVDESAVLAERLGAERVFAGAMERDGGTYGIALLSKVPLVGAERFQLPDSGNFEPRVGIDATVCQGNDELHVLATHADFLPWAADSHARAIADRVAGRQDVLVLGDLNAPPETAGVLSMIKNGLTDALAKLEGGTFGDSRIDYILTDRHVIDSEIIDSDASDHRPVKASLENRPL